ncbi:Kelch repeat-containing protein [Haloarchaeobius sp. DFWS5]|uniref:Kelch repeat-containing protein n=1 Tax=Haloarchaeobius sp. DFWS5 TaxID=3446114 RepID=UPI003EB87B19
MPPDENSEDVASEDATSRRAVLVGAAAAVGTGAGLASVFEMVPDVATDLLRFGDSTPNVPASGPWSTAPPMPDTRTEVKAKVLDGTLFVVGGFLDGKRTATDHVVGFDLDARKWHAAPPLPQGLHHTSVAVVDGTLYVIGGYTNEWDAVDSVFAFDGSEWSSRTAMPDRRGALGAGVIDGRIYVTGGNGSGGLKTALDVYDPVADEWSSGPDLPTPREHLAVAATGGTLYAVGGRQSGLSTNVATAEAFSPKTGEWTTVSPMPTARGGLDASVVDGQVFVFGGESPGGTNPEVEAYDPATDSWTTYPRLPTARHGLGTDAVDGRIYTVAGGKKPGYYYSSVLEVLTVARAQSGTGGDGTGSKNDGSGTTSPDGNDTHGASITDADGCPVVD